METNNLKRLVISLSCLGLMAMSEGLDAQVDDAFWFVAPEVTNSHGDDPVVLRFASFDDPATITVSMPADPSAFPPQTLELDANDAISLDLTPWLEVVENKPFDGVHNKGLRIVSTKNISTYYEVNPSCACNPDIFALKGENAEGSHFFVPFQTLLNNSYGNSPSGFDVVATEPNTTVTITPTKDLQGGHPANEPYEVFLPFAGSTYSARATGTSANSHATGTVVSSDHPIAITIHDDSANGSPFGGCSDLMGDQLVPIEVVGTEYIAIKGYLNGADRVYFVATEDATEVMLEGAVIAELNAGESFEYVLSEAAAFFETNLPVYVWHLTGFGCEVGGAVLPSVECTGSPEVVFVRSTGEFIGMNVLVPSGAEGDFLFNDDPGVITPDLFQDVPGSDGNWKYAQIPATSFVPQLEASRLRNTSDYFHLGIVHGGGGSGTRYGYFSDYGAIRYQVQASQIEICVGESITLATATIENGLYQWTGPSGFEAEGPVIELNDLEQEYSGVYVVQGYVGECGIENDSVWVEVHPYPEPPVLPADVVACAGDTLVLVAEGNGTEYHWTGPDGELLNATTGDSLILPAVSDTVQGVYSAVVVEQGCASDASTTNVHVVVADEFALPEPLQWELCSGQTLNYSPSLPEDVVIEWFTPQGETFTLNGDQNLVEPFVETAGYYVAMASILGCPMGSDSLELFLNPLPEDPSIAAPPLLCEGDEWTLTASGGPILEWLNPNGEVIAEGELLDLGEVDPDEAGTYQVQAVTPEGCGSEIISIQLEVQPLPSNMVANWSYEYSICPGDPIELTILDHDVDYDLSWTYLPQDGGAPQSIAGATTSTLDIGPGLYVIDYSTGPPCNLSAQGQIQFTYDPCSIFIPNVITPWNADSRNDAFEVPGLFAFNNSRISIYNRWGQLMYSHEDFGQSAGWSPSMDEASEGTYYWVLHVPNPTGYLSVEDINGISLYDEPGEVRLTGSFQLLR